MKKGILLSLLFVSIFTMGSFAQFDLASKTKDAGNLVENIMSETGVNKEQAMGGAGALFEMAEGKMNAGDFKDLANAVPDMQGYLDAVPSLSGGNTSLLSSAATTLTGMPKVQAQFEKLGIGADKVALFTPVIVNYVEKKGGKLLGGKLLNALK
ncbi:DUF2780 domain-containing protein [Lentimicrobium sp. L6]|uniref:DUF2780 domain-containing protein n=1 Tax=Lentimicrobium sp. L6 TaxID=2735916 RepID=UPI001552C57F|nr:DUF2780 domain-containing protein [Lentimicrobium sp. L6]NPD85022.1 DUF2780 domain-containing protein [Lentimicrobium sp. L6]